MIKSVQVMHRFTPAFVAVTANFASTTSFTITPGTAVTPGNVMVVCFGGPTSGGVPSSIPSGWVQVPGGGATYGTWSFIKTVTASEPANYTFTFTASIAGGWTFQEFSGLEPYSEATSLISNTGSSGTSTSYLSPAFSVPGQGVVISNLGKNTASAWTPSAGWTPWSGSGQQKTAYKIYSDISIAETITWSGTSSDKAHHLFFLRAKTIRF